MDIARRPHDEFFKAMMFDVPVARDFFEAHLSEDVLNQIDLNSLQLSPGTLINRELKARHTDILYKVDLKNGEKGYIFLLVEHQSTPDPVMAFRTPNYVMRILDRHINEAKNASLNPLPLPTVFPILFYNGEKSYTEERYLFNLFSKDGKTKMQQIFNGPLNLWDVSLETNQDLRGQKWASLLSWCMRYSAQREFSSYLHDFGQFIKDIVAIYGWREMDRNRIEILLNYIMASLTTSADSDTLIKALLAELPVELEDTIMTLGEQLIAKGKIEGRIEGIEETLVAITLINKGTDNATIMNQTGLSLDIIEKLRKKMLL